MKIQPFKILTVILFITFLFACSSNKGKNKNDLKQEIINVEKEFEAAAQKYGMAQAFYDFADENAVIKRKNDTLIKGNENIRKYYEKINLKNAVLTWTPDFVGVSEDGTLGYTYGSYVWKNKDADGKTVESRGVFHTVWKKQSDGKWKYVWD
jgi:ketosteroid isomerase-like protein